MSGAQHLLLLAVALLASYTVLTCGSGFQAWFADYLPPPLLHGSLGDWSSLLQRHAQPSASTAVTGGPAAGTCSARPRIAHLASLQREIVNHPPFTNYKQVFVRRGEIPYVMNFALATFPKGGDFGRHEHATMFEIFLHLDGQGEFLSAPRENATDAQTMIFKHGPGSGGVVLFPPHTPHAGRNTGEADWRFLVLGFAPPEADGLGATELGKPLAHADFRAEVVEEPLARRRPIFGAGTVPRLSAFEEVQLRAPSEHTEWRAHADAHAVFLVLEGSGQLMVDKEERALKEFDVAVVPPKVLHELRTAGGSNLRFLHFLVDVSGAPDCAGAVSKGGRGA